MQRRTFLGAAALAVTGGALADEKKRTGQAVATPASDTIEEKPRNVPVVQDCDVCVLGGSCTGVFAAVRAAQMGAKVALVEKQNAFGGVATAALVNIWHKLISNKGKEQIIGSRDLLQMRRQSEHHSLHLRARARPRLEHFDCPVPRSRLTDLEGANAPHQRGKPIASDPSNRNRCPM